MDLPIPTHLQSYFRPIGNKNDEYRVTGEILCHCNCGCFEVWHSNDQQIVKLICKKCGKEILLFDAGKHGWNGFVCKDDFLNRTEPFVQYRCKKCKRDGFQVVAAISSQGKQDFLEECVSNDNTFTLDDWVDGFEWIDVSLTCCNCQHEAESWIDLETM